MITNEEARKAIEKYQKEHPLPFGTMLDVTAISSKEGVDIISQTIERVSKKIEEDTDLWCICEMAKMYMQGVKPVYSVRQTGEWIPVSERLPEIHNYTEKYLVTLERGWVRTAMCTQCDGKHWWSYDDVIAWMPLPKAYEPQESEDNETI
jgi:hypothetical protein